MGMIRYRKCMGIMVKALAISLRSENSTFAPSGWFMHAWSHFVITTNCNCPYFHEGKAVQEMVM